MTTSVLDGVPGLGPARQKRLRKELGGVNAVKAVSLETLKALPWLPDKVAEAVYERVHPLRSERRRPRQPVPFTGDDTGANPT
jgi:excinuclease ABC subunit C